MALAIIVLIGLVALVMVLSGRERLWERMTGPADLGRHDFSAGLRSNSPNDALACTAGTCDAPDVTVAATQEPPEAVVSGFAVRLASIEPRVRRVDDHSDPFYARFVVYTRLMRFPDTIDIEAAVEADGSTAIRAYSRSKLGRSDFGVNRKRLERLFDRP